MSGGSFAIARRRNAKKGACGWRSPECLLLTSIPIGDVNDKKVRDFKIYETQLALTQLRVQREQNV